MTDELDIRIRQTGDEPQWTAPLRDALRADEGEVIGSSSSRVGNDIVAWALAVASSEDPELAIVGASTPAAPRAPLVMVCRAAETFSAMMHVRSLVHRSPGQLSEGALVSTWFSDLARAPLALRYPRVLVTRADQAVAQGVLQAIALPWCVALSDSPVVAAPLSAAASAIEPFEDALRAMAAAIRTGTEPMLSNAAFALQELRQVEAARPSVDTLLEQLASEPLADASLDVVDALLE
jgi:hypothetical protein